jgi:hypothetical protein
MCDECVLDFIYASKLRKMFPATFLYMVSENLLLTKYIELQHVILTCGKLE